MHLGKDQSQNYSKTLNPIIFTVKYKLNKFVIYIGISICGKFVSHKLNDSGKVDTIRPVQNILDLCVCAILVGRVWLFANKLIPKK